MSVGSLLAGKQVALCVTGSIAAYKAVLLTRRLLAEGADVHVVMTASARELVGPATFAGLTGRPALGALFAPEQLGEPHVELGRTSALVLVVPATADALARFAHGRADDLVSALVLCARCPVLAAPAMHPSMWSHPATARNVALLAADGRVRLIGPVSGEVASGDVGLGRMAEPDAIVAAALDALAPSATLRGVRLVVTAGPTTEDIDPVRYLGNRSSGKLGFAVAARAAELGATVTLVAGPVSLPTPPGVTRIDVRTAEQMKHALANVLGPELSGADALVMTAAVADYRPAAPSATKLRRTGAPLTLELVPNPDILAEIGARRGGSLPVLVGFALGTDDDARAVVTAREKLAAKRVDFVVSNRADEAIGRDDIRALFVTAHESEEVPLGPKRVLAERLLARVAAELVARRA